VLNGYVEGAHNPARLIVSVDWTMEYRPIR